jgi:hypothetical protein
MDKEFDRMRKEPIVAQFKILSNLLGDTEKTMRYLKLSSARAGI